MESSQPASSLGVVAGRDCYFPWTAILFFVIQRLPAKQATTAKQLAATVGWSFTKASWPYGRQRGAGAWLRATTVARSPWILTPQMVQTEGWKLVASLPAQWPTPRD